MMHPCGATLHRTLSANNLDIDNENGINSIAVLGIICTLSPNMTGQASSHPSTSTNPPPPIIAWAPVFDVSAAMFHPRDVSSNQ